MQRVLVTGATGFVGSHTARRLVAGGVEVHALLRPGAGLWRIPDLVDDLVLHEDDGTHEGLASVIKEASPEITFHLAARYLGEHTAADIPGLITDNVAFPTRLAEALASTGFPSMLNVGTVWQHVGGAAYKPKSLYAATKQAFEDVLVHYVGRDQLRVITVNLYDTYGPKDRRGKLISSLVSAARDDRPMDMTSGHQLIDLLHATDLAAALVVAAERCLATESSDAGTFAAATGHFRTLREVVEVLGDVAGHPVPVRWGARPDRPGEMLEPWSAGPPLPGWQARVTLEEGFAGLLAEPPFPGPPG